MRNTDRIILMACSITLKVIFCLLGFKTFIEHCYEGFNLTTFSITIVILGIVIALEKQVLKKK